MANTRIKVRRDVLVEKLRSERAAREATFARETVKYDQVAGEFMRRLEDEVEAFVGLLATDTDKAMDRVESSSYDGASVYVRFPKLRKPQEPKLQTGDIDRLLRVLEVADDEIISIAADDQYARYL